MKFLAAFVMRGRLPAATLAATAAALALLVTPLAIISSAVPALVALRLGAREAGLVSVFGLLGLAALGALLFGHPAALVVVGVALWLPLVLLGLALRTWRSLALTVELAVLAGFGLVIAQHLLLDDPAAYWADLMRAFFRQMIEAEAVSDADVEAFIGAIAPWMAGGVAAAWTLQQVAALLLARAWQAGLYNPGGFRSEFHQLRLGRWLAIAVPVLLVAGMFAGGAGPIAQLSVVGMVGFFLQGVALVHGLVGRFKAGFGWLVGFYLLLFVGMPHSFTAVSAAGFADSWLNLRARAGSRGKAGDD